jgi:hypothetical protein
MEKPVIILTTTVSRPGPFASDAQRLNVALTRAKHHLIIVGDLNVLPQLAPAFLMLLEQAGSIGGGVCRNVASFIPQSLPDGERENLPLV